MYAMAPRPAISSAEFEQLEAAQQNPSGICNQVRPETLGYQQCWRLNAHAGAHISQDGKAWITTARPRDGKA